MNNVKKKEAIPWLVLLVLYLFIFMSIPHLGVGKKTGAAFLAVGLAAVFFHVKDSEKTGGFVKSVLGISANKANRIAEYDYMRMLAAILVCTTHALASGMNAAWVESAALRLLFTILYLLALSCNSLYVFLSGALLLPPKKESLLTFYKKRMIRVLIPLFIYYYWYLWSSHALAGQTPFVVFQYMRVCSTPQAPHLWLICVIVYIYLLLPLYRWILSKLPYAALSGFAAASMAFLGVRLFVPILETRPVLGVVINWTLVLVIGYWISREETRRFDRYIMIAGLLATAFTIFLVVINGSYEVYVLGCTPTLVLVAAAVFSAILNSKHVFKKGNILIGIFSKYSYGIILIHWWVLHHEVLGFYNMSITSKGGLGAIAVIVVTFVFSLLFSVFMDQFLCYPVEQIVVGVCGFVVRRVKAVAASEKKKMDRRNRIKRIQRRSK